MSYHSLVSHVYYCRSSSFCSLCLARTPATPIKPETGEELVPSVFGLVSRRRGKDANFPLCTRTRNAVTLLPCCISLQLLIAGKVSSKTPHTVFALQE